MGRVVNVSADNKGGTFEPIPHGTNVQATVFAIEEVAVKSGDNAGKPQLQVTFKVQEPNEKYNGREIRYQNIPLYDSPGAWKLIAFADAVGWPHKDGNVEIPDNLLSVQGSALTIKVNQKPKDAQGRIFNEVGGYAPAKTGTGSASTASDTSSQPSWGGLNGS